MSLERNFEQHQMLQNDVASIANLNCAVPSEKIDCFSILPPEMFLKIFKHLELSSLGKCGVVSSYWNTIASDPTLYYNISEKFKCEKQMKFLKMLIKWRNNVRKFEYNFDRDDLFVVHCKSHICILSWPICFKCSRSKKANFSKTLTEFFKHCCQKLTHLKLRSNFDHHLWRVLDEKPCFIQRWTLLTLSNLEIIEISNQFFSKTRLIKLLNRNPKLECLKLDECFGVITLNCLLATIGRSNKKMSCLELHFIVPNDRYFPVPGYRPQENRKGRVEEIPIECPNLKKLKLTESKFLDYNELLETLYLRNPKLTNLTNLSLIFKPDFKIHADIEPELTRIKNQANDFCTKVFENLPKLEELELSSNLIHESEINRFEKRFPKLRIVIRETKICQLVNNMFI